MDKCPHCGTELEVGFGLAGGGYGAYTYCPSDECGKYFDKTQERDDQTLPGVRTMTENSIGITARAVFDILNPVAPAVENLACHQEQCDQDGVMVKVSRQALDEVLEAINKLAIAAAQDAIAAVVGSPGHD